MQGVDEELDQKLLESRLEVIRLWCIFLFNNEHRCIMDHIAEMLVQHKPVTLKTLSEFRNAKDLVT